MKRLTLIFTFAILTSFAASAQFTQLDNHVTWSYAAKKISKTEAMVYLKATIDGDWHIYSQFVKPGGPNKTIFTFAKSKDYSLLGGTIEPKPITKYEKVFSMNVSYFEKEVLFKQKIKLNKGATTVKGTVEFMVCNETQCLPPSEVSFSIPVK